MHTSPHPLGSFLRIVAYDRVSTMKKSEFIHSIETHFNLMINVVDTIVWKHRIQKCCTIADSFICWLGGAAQWENAECRQQHPMCFLNQLENCKSFQRQHEKSAECIQSEADEDCACNGKKECFNGAALESFRRCWDWKETSIESFSECALIGVIAHEPVFKASPGKRSSFAPSTTTYFIRPNPHPLEGLPKAALNSAENDSFISEIISNTSS